MVSNAGNKLREIDKWCYFTETEQEFPDVCLVTKGVFLSSDDCEVDDEDIVAYESYGWYKITFTETDKSVFRRIRTATLREGYPNGCLVLDSYTAKELGLDSDSEKRAKYDPDRFQIHYRNKKQNICNVPYDKKKGHGIAKHLDGCETEPTYFITGFPIFNTPGGYKLVIEKVNSDSIESMSGRTLRHPDYAISLASKIALISSIIAVIALLIGIASFVIGIISVQPDSEMIERLDHIEQQLAQISLS